MHLLETKNGELKKHQPTLGVLCPQQRATLIGKIDSCNRSHVVFGGGELKNEQLAMFAAADRMQKASNSREYHWKDP